MHKLSLLAMTALALIFSACNTSKQNGKQDTVIDYKVANHYFFNNNAEIPDNPIVTDRKDIERLYGAAPVMGRDGLPTEIDFKKEFVIGVVLPITNHHTEIILGKLTENNDTLTLTYSVKRDKEEMSWSMQPMSLIIVDKRFSYKTCILKEVK